MSLSINPPCLLTAAHKSVSFDCGYIQLNDWLQKKALANQKSNASRTFVCTDINANILGYYALAAGAVSHIDSTSNIKRNMPDPIPVIVLGRLAVDNSAKGHGLGVSMLQDAIKRSMSIAENAGVRAVLVHAIDQKAAQFYLKYDFIPSPINPLTLLLKIS